MHQFLVVAQATQDNPRSPALTGPQVQSDLLRRREWQAQQAEQAFLCQCGPLRSKVPALTGLLRNRPVPPFVGIPSVASNMSWGLAPGVQRGRVLAAVLLRYNSHWMFWLSLWTLQASLLRSYQALRGIPRGLAQAPLPWVRKGLVLGVLKSRVLTAVLPW